MTWYVIKRNTLTANEAEYELASPKLETKLAALAHLGRLDCSPEYELALVSDESGLAVDKPDSWYIDSVRRDFTDVELRVLDSLLPEDFANYLHTADKLANVILAWKQVSKSLDHEDLDRLLAVIP